MEAIKQNNIDEAAKASWVHNLILVFVSILGACLLAEFILRMTMPGIVLFPRFHAAAQYGDYALRITRPNTRFTHTSADGSWNYVINAQGFRDVVNYSYAKPAGTLRVLVLGDSHTLGYEVRQDATFSEVMKRRLTAQGIAVEVLNTGVSGFSTAEELAFLENEGVRYDPDLVVLGFYRNDFEDNLKAGLFRLQGETLVTAKQQHLPGVRVLNFVHAIPGLSWLGQNSYLYSFVSNTVWDLSKRALRDKAMADLTTEYAVGTREPDAEMKHLAMRLVERIHAATRARNIPLIIAEIPASIAERDFTGSIPADLQGEMRANAEIFVSADEVFAPYRDLTEFHVPHGNGHINEFTHLMLGMTLADRITDWQRKTLPTPQAEMSVSAFQSSLETTEVGVPPDDGIAELRGQQLPNPQEEALLSAFQNSLETTTEE